MGAISRSRRSRAWAILLGYNAPFVLWTVAAVVRAWTGSGGWWPCPVAALLGWCPSCGLTGAYAALLSGRGVASAWFAVVFGGFVANAAWSVVRAWRAGSPSRTAGLGGPERTDHLC